MKRLKNWAGEHFAEMDYTTLSGHQLIFGIGEQVRLCLNVGTDFYKQFSQDEIQHLKRIIAKTRPTNQKPSTN